MPSIVANINPEILVWARQTAGYSLEEAARKIGKEFPVERLSAWEAGKEQTTVAKMRDLSRIYKRPLAVFFLQEVPRDFQVPRDFRRLPGEVAGHYTPKLLNEIRQAYARRAVALELFEELDEEPPQFTLSGTMAEGVAVVAARAREALGISLEVQVGWADAYAAVRDWRTAIERLGVLVFLVPEISSDEMRGVSLYEPVLPVMAVNRGEAPQARIFSMLHELVHLMLRESGICDFEEFAPRPPEEQKIEVICNAVAASILLPEQEFKAQLELAGLPTQPTEVADGKINALARRFSVSREVIVRRMLAFRYVSTDFYLQKRAEYRAEFIARREHQTGPVIEKYGAKRVRILGQAFSRLVLDNYAEGHITLSDVSNYLGMKLKHLPSAELELEGA